MAKQSGGGFVALAAAVANWQQQKKAIKMRVALTMAMGEADGMNEGEGEGKAVKHPIKYFSLSGQMKMTPKLVAGKNGREYVK